MFLAWVCVIHVVIKTSSIVKLCLPQALFYSWIEKPHYTNRNLEETSGELVLSFDVMAVALNVF